MGKDYWKNSSKNEVDSKYDDRFFDLYKTAMLGLLIQKATTSAIPHMAKGIALDMYNNYVGVDAKEKENQDVD